MEQQADTSGINVKTDKGLETVLMVENSHGPASGEMNFSQTSDSVLMQGCQTKIPTQMGTGLDEEGTRTSGTGSGSGVAQPPSKNGNVNEESDSLPPSPSMNGNLVKESDGASHCTELHQCVIKTESEKLVDEGSEEEAMDMCVAAQLETLNFSSGPEGNDGLHQQEQLPTVNKDVPQVHVVVEADAELTESSQESSSSGDSSDSDSDSSSSSSSSTSSSSTSSSLNLGLSDIEDGDPVSIGKDRTPQPVKTKDEIILEDLPDEEDITIVVPENTVLMPIGVVSSIIERLVIIESLKDTLPIQDNSIIFNEKRLAVGKAVDFSDDEKEKEAKQKKRKPQQAKKQNFSSKFTFL
ncbi:NAF1 protein, partial [Polypterus senegalus]|nr:NAF1 protein [Polypterus senegalus]